MTGKAQQAYAAMKVEDAGTYQRLKEAILRRYDISEETYRQRFRDAERKDSESVSNLAVRITDIFLKWTKSCKSIEEIRDLMVMEQLLHTLPSEIKVWVTERKPKTSTEAAEMAENYLYLRARKQQKDGRQQQERKPWAIAKGPWEDGKRMDSSPKPAVSDGGTHRSTNGRWETLEGIHCYNCGKKGHISRNCSSNALCGMEWEEVGLKRRGTVEGTEVRDIMLDTGCTRTMVQGDLISKDKIHVLEGKSAVVRCAHGDTVLYSLAQICMEVDGCVINTVAAVSHTLPMAVLLGVDVPELSSLLLRRAPRRRFQRLL